jgi:peptidoglycan-associated lipoprotein
VTHIHNLLLKEVFMKKVLFSALTLSLMLIYGCASTPESKPAEPQAGLPAAPPTTGVKPIEPVKEPVAQKPDLTKRSVFYDLDKYDIKDEYRPILQAHGKNLAQNRSMKMLIQGNCDERGSREYNIALGQRRAEGVKRMLVLMGATESQVEPVSLGEEKPRCTEHAEGCWSQNRRSDMLYGGEY